jgi:hypothetical protein
VQIANERDKIQLESLEGIHPSSMLKIKPKYPLLPELVNNAISNTEVIGSQGYRYGHLNKALARVLLITIGGFLSVFENN